MPHNLKSFCRSWQQFCSKKTENVVLKIGWSRPKKKSYAETWAAGGQCCCRQELLYTDIFLFRKQTLPRLSHKPFQRSNSMQQRKFFSQGLVGAKAHTQRIFMPHEQFKDQCNLFCCWYISFNQVLRLFLGLQTVLTPQSQDPHKKIMFVCVLECFTKRFFQTFWRDPRNIIIWIPLKESKIDV